MRDGSSTSMGERGTRGCPSVLPGHGPAWEQRRGTCLRVPPLPAASVARAALQAGPGTLGLWQPLVLYFCKVSCTGGYLTPPDCWSLAVNRAAECWFPMSLCNVFYQQPRDGPDTPAPVHAPALWECSINNTLPCIMPFLSMIVMIKGIYLITGLLNYSSVEARLFRRMLIALLSLWHALLSSAALC